MHGILQQYTKEEKRLMDRKWNKFAALYLALCMMLVGMPVIQAKAAPEAPAVSAGLESITVSGFTSGATLKLYAFTGGVLATADNVTAATYTFTNVVPNTIGYYVTQTLEDAESLNSNWVNAILRTPTLSAGIGYADAGNLFPGAVVKLYDFGGNHIASSPADTGAGTYRFTGLTAGSQYYVIQTINGVVSSGSNAITVLAPVPPTPPAASAGLESIEVSGFTSGATLKLYLTDGSFVTSAAAVTGTSYTFASVTPNITQYFVTQTVDGSESVNSNFVNPTLRTPTLLPGIGFVDAANIFPGAAITLYNSQSSIVPTSPSANGDGTYRFSGLTAGEQYYVVQSINGVVSLASSAVTLPVPPPPIATPGVEGIVVVGMLPGATLKLYTWTGSLITSFVTTSEMTYTFLSVEPNTVGYYVTQNLAGSESLNSAWVNPLLRTPVIVAGTGYVDVNNVYPGASLTLYDANGVQVSNTPDANGDGTFRFSAVAPGSGYYAVQSINNVLSAASKPVTVTPAAPSASAGVESLIASGYVSGATLKLYHWSGSLLDTATNVTAASYTFLNVEPDSDGYYVTQTFGGVESVNSSWANSLLRTPSITAGIGFIDVGNLYPGAAVTLYDADGSSVSVSPVTNLDGSIRFGGLPAGSWYYAVQSINGVLSPASELVGVRSPQSPDAPVTTDGIESILVSNFTSGATLKLYRWNGTLTATAASVTASTYIFTGVVPWHDGYYVTQTVNGKESVNSPWTVANVRTPVVTAGAGFVDVQNVYPGAVLKLYDASHVLVSDTSLDNGNGSFRFSGLAAGKTYYVKQVINQIASAASNMVTLLAAPDAPLNVKAYAGDGYATVKFNVPVNNGGSSILHYVITVSPGGKTVKSEKTSVKITGLTNGKSYTFTVKAVNAVGESMVSVPSNAVTPYQRTQQDADAGQNVVVVVNNVVQDAGTSEITEQDGKTLATVTVDNAKLEKILDKMGEKAVVLIPIQEKVDTVSVVFGGQMIKEMAEGEAILDIQTSEMIYSVSVKDLDLTFLAEQFGQNVDLDDVKMSFTIASQGEEVVFGPDSVTVKLARFTLICTYGDKTVEITDVAIFLSRRILIPDGTTPASIVNAIVEREEGVFATEPAEKLEEDGETYVVIR